MSNKKLGAVDFHSGPEDNPKLPSVLVHKGQSQSVTSSKAQDPAWWPL